MRRAELDEVRRAGKGHEGGTETEHPPTEDKLLGDVRGRGDGHAGTDEHRSAEHARASAETIRDGAGEERSSDLPDRVFESRRQQRPSRY